MAYFDNDTGILLEPFSNSLRERFRQAGILRKLICKNADWLSDSYYAGNVSRYGRSRLRAMHHVGRLAAQPDFNPFIVYNHTNPFSDEGPIGVATVIPTQRVRIPGRIQSEVVVDSDYWLDPVEVAADASLHHRVAKAVVARAAEIESVCEKGSPGVMVIGTVEPLTDHQPVGFESIEGIRVTGPGVLEVSGSDQYDVAKGGRQLWVYSMFETVSTQ